MLQVLLIIFDSVIGRVIAPLVIGLASYFLGLFIKWLLEKKGKSISPKWSIIIITTLGVLLFFIALGLTTSGIISRILVSGTGNTSRIEDNEPENTTEFEGTKTSPLRTYRSDDKAKTDDDSKKQPISPETTPKSNGEKYVKRIDPPGNPDKTDSSIKECPKCGHINPESYFEYCTKCAGKME